MNLLDLKPYENKQIVDACLWYDKIYDEDDYYQPKLNEIGQPFEGKIINERKTASVLQNSTTANLIFIDSDAVIDNEEFPFHYEDFRLNEEILSSKNPEYDCDLYENGFPNIIGFNEWQEEKSESLMNNVDANNLPKTQELIQNDNKIFELSKEKSSSQRVNSENGKIILKRWGRELDQK